MEMLRTLPGDDVRQIMWRYADRFDMQMAVQSSRNVARGLVARIVAEGARNAHEWTETKAQLLQAFDESGITSVFMDAEQGGYIEGPKNLVLALVAFELAWVDAGSATCSLASCLALSPIHERGTPEQRDYYMSRCVPPQPGEDRKIWRGSFALTEPIPYVGVDTGVLVGKVRVDAWEEGQEPMLHVDKRGRFITNMPFADFVTAAVDTDDPRIKTSCMVVLEKTDPGLWDPGANTLKMCHQLSATSDPVISVKIPASRIIGGYTIKDGAIVPNYSHSDIIAAVFSHTRVTVGLMTSAKLLSAIEPVIRYQRGRFRGGDASQPGAPRYDLGLQMKEDALHRLIDVWAMAEASASLGFETARRYDELDPLEKIRFATYSAQGLSGRKAYAAMRKVQKEALSFLENAAPGELPEDPLMQFALLEAETSVLCPACKLWNTGWGSVMMREALTLMGGYGITEDCPGFLGYKWVDTQLESIYEGPEAVQRRQISVTMLNEIFLAKFKIWTKEMRELANRKPEFGACGLAAAMELWTWTLEYLLKTKDPMGKPLYHGKRHGVTFPMADALCWLLAPRYLMLDVLELEAKGPDNPVVAEGLEGLLSFYADLCRVQAGRAAGEVGRICAELVFGYASHPVCGEVCCKTEEVQKLQERNAIVEDQATFSGLRLRIDACLAGQKLAKDRASQALTQVMIPEALDYPL